MTATSGRRVGVFGGVFDPPHLGHVVVACEAAWQLGLDEVRMVVCPRPAHRDVAPSADAEVRLELVAALCARHEPLVPSRVEIDRPGPTFTVDTLTELTGSEPGTEFTLIVGADQLMGFRRWREPERIVRLARLGVVARDGADPEAVAREAEGIAPGRVDLIAMPPIGVSSTMIRERIRAGTPVGHLLPEPVAAIVAARGLYGGGSTTP